MFLSDSVNKKREERLEGVTSRHEVVSWTRLSLFLLHVTSVTVLSSLNHDSWSKLIIIDHKCLLHLLTSNIKFNNGAKTHSILTSVSRNSIQVNKVRDIFREFSPSLGSHVGIKNMIPPHSPVLRHSFEQAFLQISVIQMVKKQTVQLF